MLNGGDMTEIGERGANLSGGQKARISLARAVYSGKDIVLMDDPISSLDSNVKQKVFEVVLCGELKHKTRILVTHAVDFIHMADRIVIMENGNIKFIGTYEELKQSEEINQVNSTVSQTHLKEERKIEEIENEDDKIIIDKNDASSQKCYLNHEIAKIIENENNEIIEVGFKPYIHLFGGDFNWITYLIIIPFLAIFAYYGVQSSYYLGIWIKNSEKKEVFWSNFISVIYYVIGFTLSRNIAAMLVYYSTIRKSRLLHERMIRRILNAPLNTYFDKTPSGSILNRFSRDLSKLDEEIFRAIISLVESITSVIYIFYIAIMNTVWVLLILPVMILLLYLVIKRYLIVNRELSRLQSVNGSPLINHFDETLRGLPTIRAFEKQEEFAYKNEEYINTKIKS